MSRDRLGERIRGIVEYNRWHLSYLDLDLVPIGERLLHYLYTEFCDRLPARQESYWIQDLDERYPEDSIEDDSE